ncbi:MAG TPA: TetR family transcriptional regulator C-terminal domain-containing protein [Steroidobacteraceae bacterium]|nr:TetR family transcriptional regulator C-terminal domain-containing protein [Steroidobacteraceae bacterium]
MSRSNGSAEPKFRRAAPDARRGELIAATLACLSKLGHEGVSVRRISAEAGVSMGLITHHFRSIDSLVAAAYRSLAEGLLSRSREPALAIAGDPLESLHAFFAASFAPHALDPAIFRTWLVFWSRVPHSAELRAVRNLTYRESCATLATLLTRLRRAPGVPAFRLGPAATGLAALMDGLWVELSLSPSSFEPRQAVALCDDWVRALAAGAFPALRRAPGITGTSSAPR